MTSANFAYNMAVSLVGGFSPFAATLLVEEYGNAAPGYIVSVLAILAWIGLFIASTGKKEDAAVSSPSRLSNVV